MAVADTVKAPALCHLSAIDLAPTTSIALVSIGQ